MPQLNLWQVGIKDQYLMLLGQSTDFALYNIQ